MTKSICKMLTIISVGLIIFTFSVVASSANKILEDTLDESLQLLLESDATSVADISVRVKASNGKWSFDVDDKRVKRKSLDERNTSLLSDDLVLPIGVNAQLLITSEDDVYPFLVPSLAIETFAVPGRIEAISLMPKKVGVFESSCNADCKPEWKDFGFSIYFVEQVSFEEWLNGLKKL